MKNNKGPVILFVVSLVLSVLGVAIEPVSLELADTVFLIAGIGIFSSAVWIFTRRVLSRKRKLKQESKNQP